MPRRYLIALPFVALIAGCGERQPEFAVVEGTITRNGRPAAHIEVAFYADENTQGPRTSGTTDANGRYQLLTETGQVGAVAGRYRVCLYDRAPALLVSANRLSLTPAQAQKLPAEVAAKLPSTNGRSSSRVPDPYTRPWETPLRAEVRPGTQALDFQIP
ncbi:hypothetical protein VT84_25395 [Gemmata sp. SH-PL17]|uniref:hypothetical protein n=1 Tax=Gemmata sp. SH-PL17 TaxID=1630693 RepID=UPI0004BC290E|nr:hypothetical protein [Gemmata sp. SH-PL17]AMV27762.1 hypothetical protein VT84_25395 [Gemmata sp. SH-PL17]